MRVAIFSAVFFCLLAGCSWMPFVDSEEEKEAERQRQEELKTLTEKEFYDRIQRNLRSKNWTDAITNLQSFEAQFPFGNYAEQAQLELIYVYFESLDYEAASAAADRFIRLHPRHPNVDYAYYIKGLAAISQTKGLFTNFIPTDESRRDPGEARQAFAIFTELLNRFPNSAYAADARQRMLHLRNLLARHEIQVANYYFKRGAYLAAVNRGRYVVENFQQTPAVPDALAVMAQGYHLLGLNDLAENTVQVLAANYANHPALDEQGQFKYSPANLKDDKHWMSKVTLGYYKPEKPPHFDSRKLYNPIDRHVAELRNEMPVSSSVDTTDKARADTSQGSGKRSWLSRLTFGLLD
ncbi:MAG TPA: outer membrane protein assembly factor BamD [Porticoccaceae bacterium]|nr:outer membrane protein assembly factor BamD [Porticoccaceae bacterium]HCO58808.1 outer membrane protein assembly factor BamD [Porticoccaceae bacterium]